jgi:hypothetical protein
MDWVPVQSSVLAAVAYAPTQLWIEFRTGQIYRYRDVPVSIYQQLLAADSKGRFFNARVRDLFPNEHMARSSGAGSPEPS